MGEDTGMRIIIDENGVGKFETELRPWAPPVYQRALVAVVAAVAGFVRILAPVAKAPVVALYQIGVAVWYTLDDAADAVRVYAPVLARRVWERIRRDVIPAVVRVARRVVFAADAGADALVIMAMLAADTAVDGWRLRSEIIREEKDLCA
jgi:hypothetical protein